MNKQTDKQINKALDAKHGGLGGPSYCVLMIIKKYLNIKTCFTHLK